MKRLEVRLRQCMANGARFKQLGLHLYIPNGQETAANSKDKANERNRKDADYDPLLDDTGEQDLLDDDSAKVLLVFWNFCYLCLWNQTASPAGVEEPGTSCLLVLKLAACVC
ncbi:unnamed protein product [Urochloa humidicola]